MEEFVKSAEEAAVTYMIQDRTSLPPIPKQSPSTSHTTIQGDTDMDMTTPPPPEKAGDQVGLEVLRGGMRDVVELVNRLRASGIEDCGLPLPRIAVVGNQSAGKSSLIEAISGIKVPRYTGTCTRCPLEINLQTANPDEEWTCTISLRFKKQHLKDGGNPPWMDIPTGTTQVHFMDLKDKNEVEPALVKAQCAVLNPSRDWRSYLTPNGGGGSFAGAGFTRPNADQDFEVQFSPNVVSMDIRAPELPNLSFIDLPGVIQSTQNEEENYLIELVQSLVREYVSEQDCLILLAMTMKDDAVNQSASRLARQLGADRTIGALTKPDTVEPGDHGQWIDILRGHSHKLIHGYFVTKQPNQEALTNGVSNSTARRLEREFFETTPPWNTELSSLKHRFGTGPLTQYLSSELGKLIRNRLPTIIAAIDRQVEEVKAELEQLPAPPPEHHYLTVERLLVEFNEDLKVHLAGKNNSAEIMLREKARTLSETLQSLSPGLMFLNSVAEEGRTADMLRKGRGDAWFGAPRPAAERAAVERDDGGAASPGGRKRSAQDNPFESPKRQRMAAASGYSSNGAVKYTLPLLRHIIESTSNSSIPGQTDPETINYLCRHSIATWEAPSDDFLRQATALVGDVFKERFTVHFKKYHKSPIFETCYSILEAFMSRQVQKQHASIKRLLARESENIATINQEDFNARKSEYLPKLQLRRQRNVEEQKTALLQRDDSQTTPTSRGRGRAPRVQVTPDMEDEAAAATVAADSFYRELEMLASTKAYHDVARKRYADNVYHSLLSGFLKNCRENTLPALRADLQIGGGKNSGGAAVEEVCRELLTEDPAQEKLRKVLLAKSHSLAQAKDELRKHLGAR